MRSPSLLFGPKILKAYFDASNKNVTSMNFNDPSFFKNMILIRVYDVTFFDLKPQSRLYEFLVQIKVMDFSFNCL